MIVQKILEHLEKDLQLQISAANTAHEAATHEESKAEDKYDTRGLEASYLAGAQAKRAAEIEQLIFYYRQLKLKSFSATTPIDVTALVELMDEDSGQNSFYFVVPRGGAMSLEVNGKKIQIVTVMSPMGEELIGKKVADAFDFVRPKQKTSYAVKSVV